MRNSLPPQITTNKMRVRVPPAKRVLPKWRPPKQPKEKAPTDNR